MRPFAFLLCLLTFTAVSCTAPKPDTDNDAETILGTWDLVKVENDGKPPPDNSKAEGMKVEITKDQLIKLDKTTGRASKDVASYKLDTKSKPRSIDISEGQMTVKGIYKLENGELTMFWGEPGKERPAKFDDKSGLLMVLRKSKATK